ncbi:MAG: carboxypeptidase regulatory-like domain-containing protein [Gemmatimonadota bacterium]|nr:carboxypeptidase regulatory-like domain-containing protein [Gemmatimonadota bacterium]
MAASVAWSVFNAAAIPAVAPGQPAATLATVKGVIVDSLHGGHLADAIVAVSGTQRIASTDSLGRFRIDGIQPGTRRIDVYHSRLDELGIALVTPLMELKAGDSVSLSLAFPSGATIVVRLCDAAQRARGPAAVFGQVLDAGHEMPVVGARLSLEWIEYGIERKRLKTSFEQRSAVSASNGHFRFCGLPGELTASLSASFADDTTAKVGVRVDPVLAARRLYLAPAHGASTTQAARASAPATGTPTTVLLPSSANIAGRVVNAKGAAVSRARIASDRSKAVALTGEDGRFELRGVRRGTRTINVRRIGFQPVEIPVDVTSEGPKEIAVRLADFVPTLDTVVVTAIRDAGLDRIGFLRRKKAGMGTFLGPDKLESLGAVQFVDLFNSVPMLRRTYDGYGRAKLVGRPHAWGTGCINYFVDGVPWLDNRDEDTGVGGIEDFIMASEVGAIEVYAGAFVPSSFVRGLTQCDMTVALWTRLRLGIR